MTSTRRTRTGDAGAVERVAAALAAAAPPEWAVIRLVVRATVLTYDFEVSARTAAGRAAAMDAPPGLLADFRRLRDDMYEEGSGTWFSAVVTVTRDAPPRADFEFDADPAWSPALAPGAFSRDLEVYPRDAEHVPDWLAGQLREAATAERRWAAGGAPGDQ